MKKQLIFEEVDVNDLQDSAAHHEVASEEQSCWAALSQVLRVTMLDAQAWDRAVEQGYIEVRAEGGLRWTLESQTLLAYFCGRLWSGDRGAYSRRKKAMVWIMGDQGTFPAAALGRLFGNTSLKQTRNRRRNMTLPEQFQIIDFLFNS